MSSTTVDLDPRSILSARRALSAVGAGLVVGAAVAGLGEPALLPVVAWVVATAVVLTWVWRILWRQDHVGTERLAEAEGRARTTDTAILVSALVSIAAVVLALVQFSGRQGAAATASVILSVVAVVLSWALVNTVFALKYARLYYVDRDGGIAFPEDAPPAYSDFAYIAFTFGMTYAAPEGHEATSPRVRRVALGHALLSYALGTGILAVAINLITNLGQS
jgi:uncharacterized membrane protein